MCRFCQKVIGKTTNMLCLLGISIGVGTIIAYHLMKHFFKRKPTSPPPFPSINSSLAENSTETLLIDAEDPDVSCLTESSFDLSLTVPNTDDDIDEAEDDFEDDRSSIKTEELNEMKKEKITRTLRRRKLRSNFHDRLKRSNDSSEEKTTEFPRGCSSSSCEHDISSHLPIFSGSLDLSSLSADDTTMSSKSCVPKTTNAVKSVLENMTSSMSYEDDFDHSTPDDRRLMSFVSMGDSFSIGQRFLPSGFTIDCEAPLSKSLSWHMMKNDPISSRSCVSVDLGDLMYSDTKISSLESRNLECTAVSSMERLEMELDMIRDEMKEMTEKVGRLQSDKSFLSHQYNLCPIDLSIDDDDETDVVSKLTSPRRQRLFDMHQMTSVDNDLTPLGHQSAEYIWDYDFDMHDDDDDDSSLGFLSNEDPVGELDSFVSYRTSATTRRRSSSVLPSLMNMSRMNRSNSLFVTPPPPPHSLDDSLESKSFNLFDVNHRKSGHLFIRSLSTIADN